MDWGKMYWGRPVHVSASGALFTPPQPESTQSRFRYPSDHRPLVSAYFWLGHGEYPPLATVPLTWCNQPPLGAQKDLQRAVIHNQAMPTGRSSDSSSGMYFDVMHTVSG